MLQRAATNAYSWWWASHIRTKQSKWLEQSLADMEEKVHDTLQIIDHDGDSFARRAEMYYRRRPEIINFVEESFRAYRALAERYDHLSRELQSANRTIAQVFPERVQIALYDEEENSGESMNPPPSGPPGASVPKAPKAPGKDFRIPSMKIKKGQGQGQGQGQRQFKRNASSAKPVSFCSGLSKAEALEEIDSLQKGILGLQTEKEFVRNVYEHATNKYWDMENRISEMQDKVCKLQDEFGIGTMIEDSDARALMATTALKSCQDTLHKLQGKREQSAEDAKVEYAKIQEAHNQLEALKEKFQAKYNEDQENSSQKPPNETSAETSRPETSQKQQEKPDLEMLRVLIKENLATSSNTNLSVIELAEKIDELVNKVVKLETAVASQDSLVQRLTTETDELRAHIKELEGDKESLTQTSETMKKRLAELEEELTRVKSLNQTVEDRNSNLQAHFTEASCNIEHLSEKLHTVKLDEDLENAGLFKEVKEAPDAIAAKENKKIQWAKMLGVKGKPKPSEEKEKKKEDSDKSSKSSKTKPKKEVIEIDDHEDDTDEDQEVLPNWRQMYLNTLDDREKMLLEEYTSVLQNYKEVRRKLNDVDKRNKNSLSDLTTQVRELVRANTMRDAEIQALRQKLNNEQTGLGDKTSATSSYDFSKDINVNGIGSTIVSNIEEKIRTDIDELVDENLGFWLRLSTSIHQKQKFITTIRDLKEELARLREQARLMKEQAKQEGNGQKKPESSDMKPIYRHLREIHTELKLWLEQNAVLEEEVHARFASLAHIQEEISGACSGSNNVDDVELTVFQAAKYQGEILNMKHESIKVENELQAGLERVKALQHEVESLLEELDVELGITKPKAEMRHSPSRARIPLRSFLFGVKLNKKSKQRQSFFACVSPSLQKQFSSLGYPAQRSIDY